VAYLCTFPPESPIKIPSGKSRKSCFNLYKMYAIGSTQLPARLPANVLVVLPCGSLWQSFILWMRPVHWALKTKLTCTNPQYLPVPYTTSTWSGLKCDSNLMKLQVSQNKYLTYCFNQASFILSRDPHTDAKVPFKSHGKHMLCHSHVLGRVPQFSKTQLAK